MHADTRKARRRKQEKTQQVIYYFTGTGNSLRAAVRLADLLRLPPPVAMAGGGGEVLSAAAADVEKVFVFPVYAWGLPSPVADFIRQLPAPQSEEAARVRAVLTCGDDTGLTDRLLARALTRRGYQLAAAYAVRMRNTYVSLPGFDTDDTDTARRKEEQFGPRMAHIADALAKGKPAAKGEALHGACAWAKSRVLRPLFGLFLTSPRRFRADAARCTRCGRCAKACPLHNVSLSPGGTPEWGGTCAHCLACYHACPRHAISDGPFTRGKGQVRVTTF